MATLTTQLEQLENSQLVRRLPDEELAYLFKHALTQESAYESILIRKRREIHRRVAEAYEQLYAERLDEFAALLTQHFAEAGVDAKTVEYAIHAGDASARVFAYTEARAFYAQALDVLKRLPDTIANRRQRIDTTIQYVGVVWLSDSPESNLARLGEVEPLVRDLPGDGTPGGDPMRRARVHYHLGRMYFLQNAMSAAVTEFEQVLTVTQEFGDQDLMLVSSSIIGLSLFLRGYFGKAQEFLAQTAASLEKAGNWSEWIRIAGFLGDTLSARGHYVEGQEQVDHVMGRAQTLNSVHHIVLAHIVLAFHYLMGGEWSRAIEAANTLITFADQSRIRLEQYFGLNFRCWAETGLGDYHAASASYAQAHALADQLGGRLLQMDWAEALHARIALLAGEIDNALAWAERSATLGQQTDSVLAIGLGERVWGETLARCNPPQWEEANMHLEASLRAFEKGDAVLEVARTHVAWGKALARRGDVDAAREHWEKAATQFRTSELMHELERTQQLVASLSV